VLAPEFSHQSSDPIQLSLLLILVERLAQMVSKFLRLKLQENTIEQIELLAIHSLYFQVQDRFQLLQFDRTR